MGLWMPINILQKVLSESRVEKTLARARSPPVGQPEMPTKKKATETVAEKLPDQGSNLEPSG